MNGLKCIRELMSRGSERKSREGRIRGRIMDDSVTLMQLAVYQCINNALRGT